MFGGPSVSDHVRLRRTHQRWTGSDVKQGTFGIVREMHRGLLSDDVVVELADGRGRVRVAARDVRRTGGRGEDGFRRARDWHRAKRFAAMLLMIPAALALAQFLIAGGHPAELVLPVFTSVIQTGIALVTGPLGVFVVIILAVVFVSRRHGRG